MLVISHTQQVNTDAELKALTTMNNYDIVWHNGTGCGFMYFTQFKEGDFIPDNQTGGIGVWRCDSSIGLDLASYKELRYKEIDERTQELILLGFTYQTKVFSLSKNAQISLLGLDEARTDLSYPIIFNTIDDIDSYNVDDDVDLHLMYLEALDSKESIKNNGTTLKESIRNSADEDAVLLIIDNR